MNTLIGILVVLLIANHYNLYKARDSRIRGRLILIHFLSINTHSNMKFELIFIGLIINVFISFDLFPIYWFNRYYISVIQVSHYEIYFITMKYISVIQMSQFSLRYGEFLISLSIILSKYLLGGPRFTLFIWSYFISDDG